MQFDAVQEINCCISHFQQYIKVTFKTISNIFSFKKKQSLGSS